MKSVRQAIPLLLALLLGCQTQPQQPIAPPTIATKINPAGELWASVDNNAPQRLLSEGQAYRAVASPDGRWLAVENQRMSRLVVLELFEVRGTDFKRSAINLSSLAWQQASRQLGVELEQIERPVIGIQGWDSSGDAILLQLTGCIEECTKDFEIETRVSMPGR